MASSEISKQIPHSQDLAHTRTKSFEALLTDVRRIIDSGLQQAYQSVNQTILNTYWLMGRRIVEDEQHGNRRAEYGKQQIKNLSAELLPQYGTSYNERNLYQFRNFYLAFSDLEILNTRLQNLSWSHFSRLLRVENEQERLWYMQEAANEGWSFRMLDRNINTQYFRRILAMQKEGIAVPKEKEQPNKMEFIKNPIVAEFLNISPNAKLYESDLESAIIDNLQQFLMELGKGYAFVGRQVHIRTEEDDYFIDLVFYNYILKCFVLIDLKADRLSFQDVGQMDMYLRLYDTLKKQPTDNPTIGIVLCSETNGDVVRFSSLADNPQMYAAKYELYLPTQEELTREIERQKEIYRLQQDN
ncbi:MAG: DUF1016 family protein [Paludibacteraceae bacterium]|nr:DUF1016 family protein [Paludibacteraceae bacterium]